MVGPTTDPSRTPVLVGAARTPIGRFLGGLASMRAPELGAVALRAALERSGVPAAAVDEVIFGNVLQGGVGQAPARQAAMAAGVPATVPAVTVNKVCGSGLKAVMLASQAIRAGDARVIAAGGFESMSNAPYYLRGLRRGVKLGHQTIEDGAVHDGLWCSFGDCHMGGYAEYTAHRAGVSREAADRFALRSHQRAVAAMEAGRLDREIVPVEVHEKSEPALVARDEGPRRDTSLEALARLRPAFPADAPEEIGDLVVTAGNAPGLSDGGAAVIVASLEAAEAAGWPVRARITGFGVSGGDPRDLFFAPVEAVRDLERRTGLAVGSFDLVELNEAFAVQAVADIEALSLDPDRVNVHGGAVALGHPIGCSGARILVTLLHAMEYRGAKTGLAALCLGGGNAVALSIARD
jgi:acetyl-CoA C-acetyltransferase